MVYRLSYAFRVDAFGRLIPSPPADGMAAAAGYYASRDYVSTERCCREMIEREPRHFHALHLLGVVCLDGARLPDAMEYLTRAAHERPDDPQVVYHLGTALLSSKSYAEAAAQFRRTLAVAAGHLDALNNLGSALAGQQLHAEAIDCFDRAMTIRPDFAPAHYNKGRSLAALDRLDEAVDRFRAALTNVPETETNRRADIYTALGQALAGLGRYDEALASCRAMSHLNADVAGWNASLVLLLLGQFPEGWRRYEGRWSVSDHDAPHARARVPALAEVAGRHVLLICEQGHGDMIQFARYVPLLAREGAVVTLQTYPELHALMQTLDGIDSVICDKDAEPPVDIVTPLLSLPLAFATDLATIPANVPYLRAPPNRLAIWQRRLGPRNRPRVGICWWGSQHIPKRSMPIAQLLPLLRHADLEFHALQKEIPPAQLEWLQQHPMLTEHSASLDDFADTAALISMMDLVVTIDTAVAHLAGALGRPVWVMLQFSADWRWLLDRNDSPWYPTARLFRQQQRGDWGSVVLEVAQALAGWSDDLQHQFEGDAHRIGASDQTPLVHSAGHVDDEHV